MKKQILVYVLMICSIGQAKSQTNDAALVGIVEKLGNKMEQLVVSGNLEEIVSMYGADAKYLPDGGKIYSGTSEIREYWKQTLTMDIERFEMNTLSVGGDEKRIHETGLGMSTIKYNGQLVEFKFKFVNIWERQENGSYKLIIDIYNRDVATE